MGACSENFTFLQSAGTELTISNTYSKCAISLESYTKGLKSRLKQMMEERGLDGTIRKLIYPPGEDKAIGGNPIFTEVIAYGKTTNVNSMETDVKEMMAANVEISSKIEEIKEPSKDDKDNNKIIIEKVRDKISSRRLSDGGEEMLKEVGITDVANIAKNNVKQKAKKMFEMMSNIPVLSAYTSDIQEKWANKMDEVTRVQVSAMSLFHPLVVYSFPLYIDDAPNILRSCIEWKTGIPFESIELYTEEGMPLVDAETLQKTQAAIYVDTRVTDNFFTNPKAKQLRTKIEKMIKDPFVYHKMALYNITEEDLAKLFKKMSHDNAMNILKVDLSVSSINAARFLSLISSVND